MAKLDFSELNIQLITKSDDKKTDYDWAQEDAQDYPDESHKKIKTAIDEVYSKWEESNEELIENFYPLMYDESMKYVFFSTDDWYDDEYLIPFIVQDKDLEKKLGIHWGDEMTSHFFNDDISKFTNDLLKALGEGSEMYFNWSVSEYSGASEEYTIAARPDFNGDYPIVQVDIERFED